MIFLILVFIPINIFAMESPTKNLFECMDYKYSVQHVEDSIRAGANLLSTDHFLKSTILGELACRSLDYENGDLVIAKAKSILEKLQPEQVVQLIDTKNIGGLTVLKVLKRCSNYNYKTNCYDDVSCPPKILGRYLKQQYKESKSKIGSGLHAVAPEIEPNNKKAIESTIWLKNYAATKFEDKAWRFALNGKYVDAEYWFWRSASEGDNWDAAYALKRGYEKKVIKPAILSSFNCHSLLEEKMKEIEKTYKVPTTQVEVQQKKSAYAIYFNKTAQEIEKAKYYVSNLTMAERKQQVEDRFNKIEERKNLLHNFSTPPDYTKVLEIIDPLSTDPICLETPLPAQGLIKLFNLLEQEKVEKETTECAIKVFCDTLRQLSYVERNTSKTVALITLERLLKNDTALEYISHNSQRVLDDTLRRILGQEYYEIMTCKKVEN